MVSTCIDIFVYPGAFSLVWENIHVGSILECRIKMLVEDQEAVHVVYVENRIRTIPSEDQGSMELPPIQLSHLMYVQLLHYGQPNINNLSNYSMQGELVVVNEF